MANGGRDERTPAARETGRRAPLGAPPQRALLLVLLRRSHSLLARRAVGRVRPLVWVSRPTIRCDTHGRHLRPANSFLN